MHHRRTRVLRHSVDGQLLLVIDLESLPAFRRLGVCLRRVAERARKEKQAQCERATRFTSRAHLPGLHRVALAFVRV